MSKKFGWLGDLAKKIKTVLSSEANEEQELIEQQSEAAWEYRQSISQLAEQEQQEQEIDAFDSSYKESILPSNLSITSSDDGTVLAGDEDEINDVDLMAEDIAEEDLYMGLQEPEVLQGPEVPEPEVADIQDVDTQDAELPEVDIEVDIDEEDIEKEVPEVDVQEGVQEDPTQSVHTSNAPENPVEAVHTPESPEAPEVPQVPSHVTSMAPQDNLDLRNWDENEFKQPLKSTDVQEHPLVPSSKYVGFDFGPTESAVEPEEVPEVAVDAPEVHVDVPETVDNPAEQPGEHHTEEHVEPGDPGDTLDEYTGLWNLFNVGFTVAPEEGQAQSVDLETDEHKNLAIDTKELLQSSGLFSGNSTGLKRSWHENNERNEELTEKPQEELVNEDGEDIKQVYGITQSILQKSTLFGGRPKRTKRARFS